MSRDLYRRKRIWKWGLFATASVAFLVILFYSNVLIQNMAKEERYRVQIWADAVSYKAELVNNTESFFDAIKEEEGKRAYIIAQTIQKLNDVALNGNENLNFYLDIISSNTTIPILIVSEQGNIDAAVNVPDSIEKAKNVSQLREELNGYENFKISYLKGRYLWVYYKESKIYTDLRVVINHLVQSFFQEIVTNAAAVPVIITDSTEKNVIVSGNVVQRDLEPDHLAVTIAGMKNQNTPIKVDLNDQGSCYVFYKESVWLSQLRYFPYLQFAILFIFIIIAYIIFSTSRKSEQNRVWVGMSKETAHQLGTPISSLMAWNELLKDSDIDQNIVKEMEKDVNRLETIAQRFSKIGSVPELVPENLVEVIDAFSLYLQTRISSKVQFIIHKPKEKELILPLNRYLFEWVIENLCKNSIDSMNGSGTITIDIFEPDHGEIVIDITDTGKGIPSSKQKTIFQPGYSSKKRGWGLGLTLAKRIIKEYHKGKLFVKKSQLDVGTTMRIVLKYKKK